MGFELVSSTMPNAIMGCIGDIGMSVLERARSSLIRFFLIAYLREERKRAECGERALLPEDSAE